MGGYWGNGPPLGRNGNGSYSPFDTIFRWIVGALVTALWIICSWFVIDMNGRINHLQQLIHTISARQMRASAQQDETFRRIEQIEIAVRGTSSSNRLQRKEPSAYEDY